MHFLAISDMVISLAADATRCAAVTGPHRLICLSPLRELDKLLKKTALYTGHLKADACVCVAIQVQAPHLSMLHRGDSLPLDCHQSARLLSLLVSTMPSRCPSSTSAPHDHSQTALRSCAWSNNDRCAPPRSFAS